MSHSLLNIIVIIISFYKDEVLQIIKSSYGIDVPSETYTPPPPPRNIEDLLNPPARG